VRLERPQTSDIVQGKLVVLLSPPGTGAVPQMRLVERVEGGLVFLEPTALFLEDDDVSETFALTLALERLRLPHVEVGDVVFYRTKPARISRPCPPNDLHAHVEFVATPGVEHFTNLIHLDFTPSLLAFVD